MCCQQQAIEAHTRRVLQTESLVPYQQRCKACNCNRLARHDIRRREFYWVDELGGSRAYRSWIVRWKCCKCKTIFTDYPPFALPEKRYTKDTVFDSVQQFCEERDATYRVPMPNRPPGVDHARLSGSSVWRWISWMRDCWWVPMHVNEYLLRYEDYSWYRFAGNVEPSKARDNQRLIDLCGARRFVHLVRIFERVIAAQSSPTLQQATGTSTGYTHSHLEKHDFYPNGFT